MDLVSVRMTVSDMFNEVVKTFPEELAELIKKETFLAGGLFKSLLLDEPVNNWNFWFRNEAALKKFQELAKKSKKTKSAYLSHHDILPFSKIMVEEDDYCKFLFPKATLFFEFAQVGTPEEVLRTFDFLHTQCYYDPVFGKMHAPTHNIIDRKLRYCSTNTMPLEAMKRAFEFVSGGWTISSEEIEKIAKGISGVNWADVATVNKQTKKSVKDRSVEYQYAVDGEDQNPRWTIPTPAEQTIPRAQNAGLTINGTAAANAVAADIAGHWAIDANNVAYVLD